MRQGLAPDQAACRRAQVPDLEAGAAGKEASLEEALLKQMDMQKKLHEQLEAQRQLQLSLEAHGRYITSLIAREGLEGRLPHKTQQALEAALAPPPGSSSGARARLHADSAEGCSCLGSS